MILLETWLREKTTEKQFKKERELDKETEMFKERRRKVLRMKRQK